MTDTPPPPRNRSQLCSMLQIRREMTAVYLQARDGKRPVGDAARLTYILTSMGRMLEGSEMEERLVAVEKKLGLAR